MNKTNIMTRWIKRILALVAFSLLLTNEVSAQGSLIPPGAPGATMKTLDQVEPRIPVPGGAVATTISAAGSYYLSGNLNRTLTISADNVTLDLMGYTIDPDTGNAIDISSDQKNITIRNGILTYAVVGLDARSLSNSNSRFENLTISNCSECGLFVGSGCVVLDCLVNACGNYGIQGFPAGKLEVRNCRITATTGVGLVAADGSHIVGNSIEGSGGDGLRLTGTNSYVADNIVKGNAINYNLAQGNQLNLLLCEIPETLAWPCSVKFAGTLKITLPWIDGITVASDDVSIDMARHALAGLGTTSGHGIYQDAAYRNLRVFNGKVVHWAKWSAAGIYAAGTASILSGLQAATNYFGIYAGNGATVTECTAYANATHGIYASKGTTVSKCASYGNGNMGINTGDGAIISECTAYGNGIAGISAGNGTTVSACAVYSNASQGISAQFSVTVSDCTARYNGGAGIEVFSDCRVAHCIANNNGYGASDGAGIHVVGNDNRIESNNVTKNDRGIDVSSSGNLIVRNSASGNTLNWAVAAGNVCLVVQATTGGAISGNSGGTAPGSTDPNANFTY